MKEISLTQGKVALVDDSDFEWLSKWKWYAHRSKYHPSFYAVRKNRKRAFLMHRVILHLTHGDGKQCDHRNHDTLDNRRENLRIVNARQNGENRLDQSRYGVGIALHPKATLRPFVVHVYFNRKNVFVGQFSTQQEATSARSEWLRNNDT